MIKLECPHCKASLQMKEPSKGRNNVFECPKCKCIFCLVLVNMSVECAKKTHNIETIALAEIKKQTRRRRGRPKKRN